MKLTELEPQWVHPEMFAFRCPHCRLTILTCKSRAMGNKEQRELLDAHFGEDRSHDVVGCKDEMGWTMSGTDFSTITVTPSIDAGASGHWHGHITNGEIVGGI